MRICEEQRLERKAPFLLFKITYLKVMVDRNVPGSTDYKYYGNRTGVAQQNSTGEGRGIMNICWNVCSKGSCNFCCGITAMGPTVL